MSAAPLIDPTSPQAMAARIREALAEMGASESSFAEHYEKDRTTLSTQLRRLDRGGDLRRDTLIKLSRYLGKSVHWIVTGEEVWGVPLSQMPGWGAAVGELLARFTFTAAQIESAGQIRLPAARRLDALSVAGFVQADVASSRSQH